jgi:Asp-tRNA(Asn)/Glu-tRNA(Gln) amidotransferase A subunit family amidase
MSSGGRIARPSCCAGSMQSTPRSTRSSSCARRRQIEEAKGADRAIAAGHAGALLGVPTTIKEAFNVAGLHTTWGNPAFEDYVADWDATVVSRLRKAGAVIVGKTNAHFMLADFAQTFNDVYGRTNNPWDPALTPGGSSGGSAAAVAAGETFLDFGSDLVGSIRIPAAFRGVYGLKPSVGVVSLTGLQPPGPPAPPSEMSYMSNVGPLARAPGDLRTALMATGGPENPAYSWALPPARASTLRDFRAGVVVSNVSSEIGDVLSEAIDALSSAGVTIVEGWPDEVDPTAVSDAPRRAGRRPARAGERPGHPPSRIRSRRHRRRCRSLASPRRGARWRAGALRRQLSALLRPRPRRDHRRAGGADRLRVPARRQPPRQRQWSSRGRIPDATVSELDE